MVRIPQIRSIDFQLASIRLRRKFRLVRFRVIYISVRSKVESASTSKTTAFVGRRVIRERRKKIPVMCRKNPGKREGWSLHLFSQARDVFPYSKLTPRRKKCVKCSCWNTPKKFPARNDTLTFRSNHNSLYFCRKQNVSTISSEFIEIINQYFLRRHTPIFPIILCVFNTGTE